MLPVTKHRTVHVPNSLAVIAALFCLAVLALHGAPNSESGTRMAGNSAVAHDTAPAEVEPTEQATQAERRSERRLGFTFFLFPSRG